MPANVLQGAIVHFDEDALKDFDYTPTPWIALVRRGMKVCVPVTQC